MESPPPYNTGKKKSNVGLIIAIILIVVCVCCVLPIVGLGGLGLYGWNKMKGTLGCSLTFTNLQRSIQDYADDHDGKLPAAATWQTDIRKYYDKEVKRNAKAQQMFGGAQADAVGCTNGDSPTTGIAFNTELAGKKVGDIKDPMRTIMLFELPKTGSNLSQPYKAQPFDSSPTMLNSKRGWYVCPVSGTVELVGRNGVHSPVNMNTGPEQ